METNSEKIKIFKDYEISTTHDPLLEVKNLVKSYQELDVLKGINMSIKKKETIVIIGSSGGGKSTLLRCINALCSFDSGEIRLDGELIGYKKINGKMIRLKEIQISKQRVNVGMIFQNFNLFPHFTAINNIIEAPVRVKKVDKEQAYQEAKELLKLIGLESKADVHPSRLSGGQQQRIAIARAIAMKPKLMLYDEVTSALDPELIGEVLEVMKLISKVGITSIVVTHEMSFAKEVADLIYFLDEGKIIEYGPPNELLNNPSHKRTKEFINSVLK